MPLVVVSVFFILNSVILVALLIVLEAIYLYIISLFSAFYTPVLVRWQTIELYLLGQI